MKNILSTQQALMDKQFDALIVTSPINIFYLTGFSGLSPTEREAILVVKKNKSTLITARLYQQEAQKLASSTLEIKIANERNEYESFIKESLQIGLPAEAFLTSKALASDVVKVGFEASNLTFAEYKNYKKYALPNKFAPTKDLIENLRMNKSKEELQNIQKAQIISQNAFEILIKTIKIGQTEIEISDKLTIIIKSLGANSLAFESIIASGPNSALPHHKIGNRKIKKGEVLLLDFGAKYQDYCADLSRTVFIGRAKDNQRKIYDLVLLAQQKAIAKIKNKIKAKSIHLAVENIFEKENLKDHFIHSLGHGIGLEVHEKPSLSKKSKDILKNNMIFSVEPGLYFPWGGVRIEDLVIIKNGIPQIIGKNSSFIELA